MYNSSQHTLKPIYILNPWLRACRLSSATHFSKFFDVETLKGQTQLITSSLLFQHSTPVLHDSSCGRDIYTLCVSVTSQTPAFESHRNILQPQQHKEVEHMFTTLPKAYRMISVGT